MPYVNYIILALGVMATLTLVIASDWSVSVLGMAIAAVGAMAYLAFKSETARRELG